MNMLGDHDGMTDADIERAGHDGDVLRAYNDMLDLRQAVQQKYDRKRFDADEAWRRFSADVGNEDKDNDKAAAPEEDSTNHSNRHAKLYPMLVGGVIGIAATLLLLFCFSVFKKSEPQLPAGVMVYKADDSAQDISLTAGGTDMPLEDVDHTENIDGVQPRVTGNKLTALDYTHVTAAAVDKHSLTTPRGKDFELILSDGTRVWLNADSKIDYPARFDGKNRVVSLQGEAFFEVAKDKDRPFIVKTRNFETRVLGTRFNVRSYSDNDSHVTLIDGSVEVRNTRQGGVTRTLTPGDDAQMMQDGSIETQKVDVDSYVYWKEGFFYFDNVPLVDIMQSLGRWYNVNVIFTNRQAMKYRLHFLCDRNGGPQHAVKLLNSIGKGKIRFDGKTIIID